jgi:hypothetical protein
MSSISAGTTSGTALVSSGDTSGNLELQSSGSTKLTVSSTGVTLASALPVASGGTGVASLTANNVLLGNGTSAIQTVAPGSSGNVLTSNGTTWTSASPPASLLQPASVSATAAGGTINFDAATYSTLYYTSNASSNFTLNIRGTSGQSLNSFMAVNQAVEVSFYNTNGTTAYYQTAFTIDGVSTTVNWENSQIPTNTNINVVDIYSYKIVKTGSGTFYVTGSWKYYTNLPAPGQVEYTTAGTYTWVAPAGVTQVAVVCIGGGSSGAYGGAAGGLAYRNFAPVTPGNSYTVVVGGGGAATTSYPGNAGGDSYITLDGGLQTRATGAGGTYLPGSPSGTYTGGGSGGAQPGDNNGPGGGAGGYGGSGGSAGRAAAAYGGGPNGTAGGTGAGGGGAGGYLDGGYTYGAGGGGASLYGGAGGAGGSIPSYGTGGAGGAASATGVAAGGNGSWGTGAGQSTGGDYGGGGAANSAGGKGAVRIIWPGQTRAYPSTRTGNL